MARLVVEEQKEYPTLPDDAIVHLRVENCEVRTVQGNRGPWDKIEFKFVVLGIQSVPAGHGHPSNYEGLVGENMYGSTSMKLTTSPENKLRLWAEALLNRPLEEGFELDTDYFIGREARGLVSTYEKRSINPVTQRPFVGHQIASLMPIGGGVVPGGAPGGPVQQAPQAAPGAWGAPAQAPQQTPQDPWGAQPQQPQQGDPWAAPQQQAPAQGYAQPTPQQGFEEEPPF